jgi:hypothetical protein
MIGIKAMLDGELDREVARGRDQERLEEIGRRLGADDPAATARACSPSTY